MKKLGEILPILLAAGILLAGNGLQGTLLAVRANIEGFDATAIGLIGTTYYLGFMFGCRYTPQLIANVGHIRAFAAFAAIGAAGALLLVLMVDPVVWMLIRCATGIVFAGLSMVMESWLNERADRTDRGRIIGLYRTVDLCAVTGGQFLLPVFGAEGFALFAISGILFCLALVPVSLTRGPSPKPPERHDLNLRWAWAISPLAVAGCLTVGLTGSAFRLVGPIYAAEVGLDVGQLAFFMSAGIVGGALMPLPLGWLSDRFSRRWLVVAATTGAAFSGLFLSLIPAGDPNLIYLGSFLFGAFAMPLYSLSIAHANDLVEPGEFVKSSSALLFVFGLGATIGPSAAAAVLDLFGPPAIFIRPGRRPVTTGSQPWTRCAAPAPGTAGRQIPFLRSPEGRTGAARGSGLRVRYDPGSASRSPWCGSEPDRQDFNPAGSALGRPRERRHARSCWAQNCRRPVPGRTGRSFR